MNKENFTDPRCNMIHEQQRNNNKDRNSLRELDHAGQDLKNQSNRFKKYADLNHKTLKRGELEQTAKMASDIIGLHVHGY